MGEQVREGAVVGDEDQPFAHAIEPADGKQPLFTGHEIDHAGPARRVEIGGHDSDRLVEHVDDPFRIGQSLAVDPHLGLERIDSRPQLGDDLPVDLNAPRSDQLLAGSPTSKSCCGEHLLQPLEPVVDRLEPPLGGAAGVVLVGELLPLRRPTRRDPRGFCTGGPRGSRGPRGTGCLTGAGRAWGAVCGHGGDIHRKEARALAAGNERCRGPDHTPANAPRRMPRSPGRNGMPAGLCQSRAATARGTTSGNGEPPAPASRSRAVGRRPSAEGGGSRGRCRPAGRDQIARHAAAGVAPGPGRASPACQGMHSQSMSPRPVLAAAENGTRASGPTGARGCRAAGV